MHAMRINNVDITLLPEDHLLNNYRILGLIGRGGFGITYKALDIKLDKIVAIKEYFPVEIASRHSDLTAQPLVENYEEAYYDGLQRFIDEARTLAKFDHPNVTRVYSYYEENNTGYMVMEYESGRSLKEIRKTRQFTEIELLSLITQMLDALDLIHASNYLHRDIKPDNIIIRDDGSSVLIDFGSARNSVGQTEKNLTSMITPGYAPIEQYVDGANRDKQGPWTDIYSFSATLYHAISGVTPSSSISRGDSILQTRRDTYVPIQLIANDQQYSNKILKAIDKGLEFKHVNRPANITAWRKMFGIEGNINSYGSIDETENTTIDTSIHPEEKVQSKLHTITTKLRKPSTRITMLSVGIILILPFLENVTQITTDNFFNTETKLEKNSNDSMNYKRQIATMENQEIEKIQHKIKNSNLHFNTTEQPTPYNSGEENTEASQGNFTAAVNTLLPLANKGEAFAQYDLGIIYFIRDIDESLKWFHKAAEQGYAPAQKQLGFIYDNGIRVEEDDSQAFEWYRLAAEQGVTEAQFMLGTLYMNGEGISKDTTKGNELIKRAGTKGYENATQTLAQFNRQLELMNNKK